MLELFAYGLQTSSGQVIREREREGGAGMHTRNDGVQVDPLLASWQATRLQARKQTGHYDT